jgi:hypothetical protein
MLWVYSFLHVSDLGETKYNTPVYQTEVHKDQWQRNMNNKNIYIHN